MRNGNGSRTLEFLIRLSRAASSRWSAARSFSAALGEAAANRLKNAVLRNRGKKIIAVAFAVALWFSANIEQDVEKNISAEINYANLPADLVIMNEPYQSRSLRVRGPRTELSSISSRDIAFALDLSHASPGISRFDVHTDQINLPRGVQAVGVSPAEIRIDIDRIMEKEVNINPSVALPDTGYEIIGEPRVIPPTVKIRGPRRVVSQISTISTDVVSTAGVRSSFTLDVPIKVPPGVEILDKRFARVTVEIQEKTVMKEFKDMDITLVNSDGVQFEPQEPLKAELVFEGPYSIIKNLSTNDIEVSADASKIKENPRQRVQRLRVKVTYPFKASLTLKKKTPEEIQVILKNAGG